MEGRQPKILVIGDSCKDIYTYGKCPRLCPDAPVPVFIPKYTVNKGGMALNVYDNVISLGIECDLVTNTNSIKKTRFVDDKTNQIIIRVDEGEENTEEINVQYLDLNSYDGVIISDYVKGFLSEDSIQYICENHNNVLIDTKRLLGEYCSKAKFIKINEDEYNASKHLLPNLSLYSSLIITLGSKGCKYLDKIYPVKKVEIKDQTGAGDTFVAAFLTMFIKNKNIDKSLKFANDCSTYVVQKRGVVTLENKKI
jgi:bifunctional ADP-heptose synthase (sugar kinase/adenylyltransferase)|tara:strand:+ start:1113 stop:1871 length:759 start_codon:yes stop_codon:yes gene_type:complete